MNKIECVGHRFPEGQCLCEICEMDDPVYYWHGYIGLNIHFIAFFLVYKLS